MTKEQVAIKVIRTRFKKDVKYISREIEVHTNCKHPNIVLFLYSFLHEGRVYIIMEYCDAGSLFDAIQAVTLTEARIIFVMQQILQGLACIHDHNYIHRDIKSENILLNSRGEVKIADLGLCVPISTPQKSLVGTPHWMAPELIARQTNYDDKVDVWSFGCLCMEMCQGGPPYANFSSVKAVFYVSIKGAPPLKHSDRWSPEFNHFVSRCFEIDSAERPTVAQLLADPLMSNKEGQTEEFVATFVKDLLIAAGKL